jgi:HAD superfamily hydrolase (TIGR01509 family)
MKTPPPSGLKWAALFDWDGVVIDSRRQHEESWERLATETNLPLPADHFLKGFGRKNECIIPHLLRWTEDPDEIRTLSLRKEELYRLIVAEKGLEALPGVREWLARLTEAGIPCVIGSSSHRENIRLSLDILRLSHSFNAWVTSEDVLQGKPDPEVFLKAASEAGFPPNRCIVFEDAHVGIAAARAAGMRVIGVATTHPKSELHAADLSVERLDELDITQLTSWFQEL